MRMVCRCRPALMSCLLPAACLLFCFLHAPPCGAAVPDPSPSALLTQARALIAEGDEAARLAYEAMAYSVAREIGSMAAALSGKVDAILVTGGVAYDNDFVALVQKRVQWIAPVLIYPGEDELAALAEGAWRFATGQEDAIRLD